MPSILIRPFHRNDREQVTQLVNAHIGAVLPGVSVSVNAVMSQLEREPGEAIVDPWVSERTTLVAIERERVVAAAHLLRYAEEERVADFHRNLGEIRWFVCVPENDGAGVSLMAACVEQLNAWQVTRQAADVSLPCPCCYGVPDCWPHLRELFVRGGFRLEGRTEVILAADLATLPAATASPLDGLAVRREMGGPAVADTRFSAICDGELVGFVDLLTDLTNGGTLSRLAGWGELDSLYVEEAYRRRGVATCLIGHVIDWLRLGHADRLIAYCLPEQTDVLAFAAHAGWRELARTERGWIRETG
ncbi:MAG: GNAT family N-acetyltransferase [Actinomycetota bacterium]|nr:GNAT family N-acetyltransferase [Actinomycetota bacterium]